MNDIRKQIEETKQKLDLIIQINSSKIAQSPEKLDEFLIKRAMLNKFSSRNIIAILGQDKETNYLASYNQFHYLGIPLKKEEYKHPIKIYIPVKSSYITDNGKNINITKINNEQEQKIKNGEIEIKHKINYKVSSVYDITQTVCPVKEYRKYIGKNYNHYQKEIEKTIELIVKEPNKNFKDIVNLLDKTSNELERNCITKILCTHYKIKEPDGLKNERLKLWSEYTFDTIKQIAQDEKKRTNSTKLNEEEFQKKVNNTIIAYLDNITNHYKDITKIFNKKFDEVVKLSEKNKPKEVKREIEKTM